MEQCDTIHSITLMHYTWCQMAIFSAGERVSCYCNVPCGNFQLSTEWKSALVFTATRVCVVLRSMVENKWGGNPDRRHLPAFEKSDNTLRHGRGRLIWPHNGKGFERPSGSTWHFIFRDCWGNSWMRTPSVRHNPETIRDTQIVCGEWKPPLTGPHAAKCGLRLLILSFFSKDRTKGQFPPPWFRALKRREGVQTKRATWGREGFHDMDHHPLVTLAGFQSQTRRLGGEEGPIYLRQTQSEGQHRSQKSFKVSL